MLKLPRPVYHSCRNRGVEQVVYTTRYNSQRWANQTHHKSRMINEHESIKPASGVRSNTVRIMIIPLSISLRNNATKNANIPAQLSVSSQVDTANVVDRDTTARIRPAQSVYDTVNDPNYVRS